MPSGTTLYLTFIFAVIIAVCIPLALRWISRFLLSAPVRTEKGDREVEKNFSHRINTRFFVGLNVGVLMAACLLLFYPLTHLFRGDGNPGTLTRAVILIFFASLFLGIALVLLQQKKLLRWQGSDRRKESSPVD